MNISRMIEKLEKVRKEHGEIEVFFDCPKCDLSFSPGVLVTKALHMKQEDKE